TLPPAGQSGGQTGQPPRPAGGPAERAFSNGRGNSAPGAADDAAYQQQVSYVLGRNFAMNLRDMEVPVDFQFLMAGISDLLRAAQPKWSEQQMDATQKRFEQEMQRKMMTRMQQMAAKNQQD